MAPYWVIEFYPEDDRFVALDPVPTRHDAIRLAADLAVLVINDQRVLAKLWEVRVGIFEADTREDAISQARAAGMHRAKP